MRRRSIFEQHPRKTLLAVVLVSVLAIDVAVGLLLIPGDSMNFRRSDPDYHHGLIPNRTAESQWMAGSKYPVHINSLGFFDEEVRDVALEPDRRRIVFLGDSFTEGLGLPYPQTFAGLVSHQVDRGQIEILNAAALSYSPKLYYLKIRHLLETVGLKFDELYIFVDISDIQDEVLYDAFTPATPAFWAKMGTAIEQFASRSSFLYYSTTRLSREKRKEKLREKYNSKVYPPWLDYFWLEDVDFEFGGDPIFPSVRERWTFDPFIRDSAPAQKGIALAKRHMQALVDLCRQHHITPTVVVYPWMAQIDARDLVGAQVQIWREFTQANDIAFLDLFPVFINDRTLTMSHEEISAAYFIPGDSHWNEQGHRLVAEKVLAQIGASHPDAVLPHGSIGR